MKILVTGGSGFLGRHLCRALRSERHDVKVLDFKPNAEFETLLGDVRDEKLTAQALNGVEAVFHLASYIEAGESVVAPYKYAENNILGTIVLMEKMREMGIKKLIFSSSAAVYGEPIRVPIFEDDRTLPINPYGMTKLAMEALASSYVASFGFTCAALRYFNLYGPGENHDPETHAIPRFITQIEKGEEVTVWGSGEHKRDYVYIADIVEAHIKALSLPVGKFHYMNLSGKNATSTLELVTMLGELMGKKPNITNQAARPGDPILLFADGSKAKKELGWESNTDLRRGLEETVKWFKASF